MHRDTAPLPRYASHRLRVGSLLARSVLIEARPDGQWQLSPFVGEVERTIFLSGELILQRSAPSPATADEPLREVSYVELAALLSTSRDWTLYYEGRPLLPNSYE